MSSTSLRRTNTAAVAAAPAVAGRAPGSAMREQERRNRAIWVHRRRSGSAGPPPGDAEVERMVAEFLARGGRVTHCATAHALPVNNGAGRDAQHWTA